jgi:hypothetical protein
MVLFKRLASAGGYEESKALLIFKVAPLRFVPSSQSRARWEQLRDGLRRKEGICSSLFGDYVARVIGHIIWTGLTKCARYQTYVKNLSIDNGSSYVRY